MRLPSITVAPTAATAASVFADHRITATGNQTLDGSLVTSGVATFGAAQFITFTAGAGDDCSGVTFTVSGTDPDGRVQSEAIVGPNANTVTGAKYFGTVTAVSASATTGVGITTACGNAVTSVSATIRPSHRKQNFVLGFGMILNSGTATFTMQHSYDDYEAGRAVDQTYPTTWFSHATAAAKTANFDATYTAPVSAIRFTVTASSSGNVTSKFIESGS